MIHQKCKFRLPTPPALDLKKLLRARKSAKPTGDNSMLPWAVWFLKTMIKDLNRSTHTLAAVRDDLQKFLVFLYDRYPGGDIGQWTSEDTNDFFKLLKNYKRSSIRRIFSSLAHFSGYLVRKGLIADDDDPVKKFKVPRRETSKPQSISAVASDGDTIMEGDDVFGLLAEAAEDLVAEQQSKPNKRFLPMRDLAVIYVLRYSGLRASELASLTTENLELHAKSGGAYLINVLCKGGETREEGIYLLPTALKILHRYLREERDPLLDRTGSSNPHIFLSYRGKELSRIDVQRIVERIKARAIDREKEAGADSFHIKAHPHSFRHERVYSLLRAGFSESETAREIGHKGTSYIGVYSNRSKDNRAERLKDVK